MKNDFFPNNLKFLIDSGKIDVKTILKITGNNSPGLITMWKNGERQITTKDLVLIANYLNYTIDDLINKDLRFNNKEESNDENSSNLSRFNILYSKIRDLPEDKQKIIFNVTESIIKEIDEKDDNN